MSHSHSHNHNHTHFSHNKAFAVGIILNAVYIVIEFTYGIITNSMALIADAGHNLSDVAGLLLAWGAALLAGKAASSKRTYGYRKSTILASLLNSIILLIAIGAIAYESIGRFANPQPVPGNTIIVVASIGIVINTLTALLFIKGSTKDLNIKGAFLHMAADAGVSACVVVGGIIINATGFYLIDPVLSLLIVLIIAIGTWGLLKESFNMSMDAVPENVNSDEVKSFLLHHENVVEIHDVHIWALSTTETALTAHIVLSDQQNSDTFLQKINSELSEKFEINHVTIQLEKSTPEMPCNGCH